MLAFIAAVAFATIVAVVAGLVITASGAFAHDFYTNVIRHGEASEREQFKAARYAAVGIAVTSIVLALFAQSFNVAFLVALAFAVAASANLPVILLTIFWERFNTTGATIGMLVGLVSSVTLVLIGPNVLTGVIPAEGVPPVISADPIFPLKNPAIVSVPLGFLGCYLGTLLGGRGAERRRGLQVPYEEIRVQANTGISRVDTEIEEVVTPVQESLP